MKAGPVSLWRNETLSRVGRACRVCGADLMGLGWDWQGLKHQMLAQESLVLPAVSFPGSYSVRFGERREEYPTCPSGFGRKVLGTLSLHTQASVALTSAPWEHMSHLCSHSWSFYRLVFSFLPRHTSSLSSRILLFQVKFHVDGNVWRMKSCAEGTVSR